MNSCMAPVTAVQEAEEEVEKKEEVETTAGGGEDGAQGEGEPAGGESRLAWCQLAFLAHGPTWCPMAVGRDSIQCRAH